MKRLKELEKKGTPLPNFKAKLWALRIQDEITGYKTFNQLEGRNCARGDIQEPQDLVISGTDVEALFPSLRDIESARIVREAVVKSKADISNFDCNAALKYLFIVGGPAHLRECGLSNVAPKWTGPRPDLLSVGGDSGHSNKKWSFPRKTYTKGEEHWSWQS